MWLLFLKQEGPRARVAHKCPWVKEKITSDIFLFVALVAILIHGAERFVQF